MASSARLSSSREIIGLASGQDAVGYQLEITFQLHSSSLRLMRGPAVSVASAACQDGTSGFAGDRDLE
jgi:hypothetical protein